MAKAGFSDDVLDVLRQAAPTLAGAVTMAIPGVGPLLAPVMAGLAKEALSKTLGVPPTEAAINEKIEQEMTVVKSGGQGALIRQADLNLALKQAQDVEYQKLLLQTNLDHHKLDNDDRSSARQMFEASSSKMPALLALLSFVALVGYYSLPFFIVVRPENREMLMVGQKVLETLTTIGFVFWLGSSAGSKRNADSLRNELARR